MVDVLDGDVDHGCGYSNLKVDGCTQPIPQQAGEGRDGRVRDNADSQIDGDLGGRRERLRLARVRFWRTLIQRVVFAERDRAAAGFEAVDLVAGASDEVRLPGQPGVKPETRSQSTGRLSGTPPVMPPSRYP
jgi:hypothetical protein